ncbi:MAG: hypothetical protein ACRD0J_15180, partial [Acidimicrobiales bacterium]
SASGVGQGLGEGGSSLPPWGESVVCQDRRIDALGRHGAGVPLLVLSCRRLPVPSPGFGRPRVPTQASRPLAPAGRSQARAKVTR